MINMRLNEEKSNFLKVLLCLNRLTLAAALPFNLLALSRVREGYERCEVNSHMTKMCAQQQLESFNHRCLHVGLCMGLYQQLI